MASSDEDDFSLEVDGDDDLDSNDDMGDDDFDDDEEEEEGRNRRILSKTTSTVNPFQPNSYTKGKGFRGQGEVKKERLHTFQTGGKSYVYKVYTIEIQSAYQKGGFLPSGQEVRFRPEEVVELRKRYPDYSPGEGVGKGGERERGKSPVCMSPMMIEKVIGPSSKLWQLLGMGAGKGIGVKYGKVVDLSESYSRVFSQASQSQSQSSASSSSSQPSKTVTRYSFDFIERYTDEKESFFGHEVMFSTDGDSFFLDQIDIPRSGIIDDIKLQDFMSHHNFYIKFHPNVNFVVGLNGSGKSAILAALRVGLGISARKSQRGERLSDLVRHEAHTARVQIRLRNEGVSAWNPSIYGDSIIVERVIKKDTGGSQYNLYTDDNKKVEKAGKKELDRILLNMNLEIDNPCVVMTQETSKSFITSTDDKERYQLFLQGTQLNSLYHEYQESQETSADTMERLSDKRNVLKQIRKEMEETDRKLEQVKHLDKLRADYQEVVKDLVWIPVQKKEKELQEEDKKRVKFQDAEGKINGMIENSSRNVQEHQAKYDAKKAEYDEAVETGKQIKEGAVKEQQALKEMNRDVNKWENKIKDKTKRIESKNIFLKRVEADILKKQEMVKENFQAMVDQKEHEIAQREELKARLTEEIAHENREHDQALQRMREMQEKKREIEYEGERVRKEKRAISNELQTLSNAQGRKSARLFGSDCEHIYRVIEQNRNRFRKPPMGPIGLHLSLRDTQWGEAVEHVLTDLLCYFVVDNHNDERILKSLVGPHTRLRLIVQKFRDQPYQNLRLHRKTNSPTVYDILECDTPMIMNVIIDQRHVERHVLVNDIEHGKQVLKADPTCEVRTKKGGIRLFVRGGSRSTVRVPPLRARLLSGNFEDQITDLRSKLRAAEGKEREIGEEVRGAKRAEDEAGRAKAGLGNKIAKTEMRKTTIEREIRKLKEDIEEILRESNPDTSELVENQRRLEQEIEDLKYEREKEIQELKACKEKKVGLTEVFEQAKGRLDQANNVIGHFAQDLEVIQDALNKACADLSKRKDQKKMLLNELASLVQRVENMKRDVEESTKKALENTEGERRFPQKTQEQLTNKAAALKKTIEKDETEQPSERKLLDDANKLRGLYEEGHQEVRALTKVSLLINKNLDERMRNWITVRNSMARQIGTFFTTYLSKRHFIGKLEFDHSKGTLEIIIDESSAKDRREGRGEDAVGHKKKKGGERSLSGLSGGERSYSTVCLLLAMWRVLGGKFRAMDEFDVFMDSGNREIALMLLMGHCKTERSEQYLFITPDKKQIPTNSAMVTTHELKPARANSNLLGFASQSN